MFFPHFSRLIGLLASFSVLHAAPESTQSVPPATTPITASTEASRATPADASYILKANDVVSLTVFEEPDLATQTKVLQTGEAVFPLIGPVNIGGLSLSDATTQLRSLYAKDYLVDPKVSLTVNEYAAQLVSILGAVRSSGQIPIPSSGRLDLASAIAAAGGLSENADPDQISLIRANGASEQYSLSAVERTSKIQLQAGDRVLVGESRFLKKSVTLLGEVRTRGQIPFPLDGNLDLVTAIARAGGFTELANPKKVSINRKGKVIELNVQEMTNTGNKPFKLEPDDIVTVAERWF